MCVCACVHVCDACTMHVDSTTKMITWNNQQSQYVSDAMGVVCEHPAYTRSFNSCRTSELRVDVVRCVHTGTCASVTVKSEDELILGCQEFLISSWWTGL